MSRHQDLVIGSPLWYIFALYHNHGISHHYLHLFTLEPTEVGTMEQAEDSLTLKILILGNSNVGKTALLKRYIDPDYDIERLQATTGIDFETKCLIWYSNSYVAIFSKSVTLLD